MTHVVLVDDLDRSVGLMEKIRAHREGRWHSAISVLVFDREGRMLLQQRAAGKYHAPMKWANACCTHPEPGESHVEAARRRLGEELGIDLAVEELFVFAYEAELENGLIEREIDHVFRAVAVSTDVPFAREEVNAVRWVDRKTLMAELEEQPESFAPWFLLMMQRPELKEGGSW